MVPGRRVGPHAQLPTPNYTAGYKIIGSHATIDGLCPPFLLVLQDIRKKEPARTVQNGQHRRNCEHCPFPYSLHFALSDVALAN